jgi:hypothetical protein
VNPSKIAERQINFESNRTPEQMLTVSEGFGNFKMKIKTNMARLNPS